MSGQPNTLFTGACFLVVGVYTAYELVRLSFPFWAMRFELFAADFNAAHDSLSNKPSKKDYRRAVTVQGSVKKLLNGSLLPEEEPYRKCFKRRLFLLACCVILSVSLDWGLVRKPEAAAYAYCAVMVAAAMTAAVVSRYRAWRIYALARLLLRRQQNAGEEQREARQPKKREDRKAESRRGR